MSRDYKVKKNRRRVFLYKVTIAVNGRCFEGQATAREPFTAANRYWKLEYYVRSNVSGSHKQLFVLFDARARSGDTDRAVVLHTAFSEAEAKGCRGDYPKDSIWYEYEPAGTGKAESRTVQQCWTEVGPRYDITC